MTRSTASGYARDDGPASEPRLVAIVDDDASVRTSTRRLIRSFGYRAEAFATGDEFLSSPVAPDTACLLLDVRMPGIDGLEVQRRVTAAKLDIPIIFISGRASDSEELRARSAGAVDFLRKPVDTTTLRQILRKVISETGGAA
jgi:FixJ family two-component response regulator